MRRLGVAILTMADNLLVAYILARLVVADVVLAHQVLPAFLRGALLNDADVPITDDLLEALIAFALAVVAEVILADDKQGPVISVANLRLADSVAAHDLVVLAVISFAGDLWGTVITIADDVDIYVNVDVDVGARGRSGRRAGRCGGRRSCGRIRSVISIVNLDIDRVEASSLAAEKAGGPIHTTTALVGIGRAGGVAKSVINDLRGALVNCFAAETVPVKGRLICASKSGEDQVY